MGKFTRRSLLFGTGVAAGFVGTRLFSGETIPFGEDFPDKATSPDPDLLNDASLLSPTRVARHMVIEDDPADALVERLRGEIREAKAERRPVIASAARHSMGAQSLAADGTVLTLDQNWLEPDTQAQTYRVAPGMRWNDVIAQLDEIGFSPKVMQSNNDFGVAATFCVNAHGWPVSHSGFGSTVRSLKLLTADGELIECSPSRNRRQFDMAMGGYGLTGIVTELEVEMVPNARLTPKFELMPAEEFGPRFMSALQADPAIQMAYGRLDVTIDGFFDEALLITYTPASDQEDLPPAAGSGFLSNLGRHVFRAQLQSDRAKSLRWQLETKLNPYFGGGEVTRNSLINEPDVTLDDRDPTRTDILHEYFVGPDRFAEFAQACREIIPSSYQELLNITLRYVDTDMQSTLAYATEPRIAAVMLFSQEMSERGEADMHRMTQELIERTLAIGGTYYLPYRPHATVDQLRRGYRRAGEFIDFKRESDPDLVFRNGLWDQYLQLV